jgi:4-alpha-glucanotransferase
MQKCSVIIGTYNHLAEGAEASLFEETYQICWRPFLSVLYRFPDLFAVLYYSGSVLTWLEAKHPEFLMLLEEMAGRKQIELLGGGFFAPFLPLVAGQDRLGQMELLTTYIRKAFGRRPRGCWIQDYGWEPGLASSLQTCGFDFTFLPERQFRFAGANLELPVVTEDQGRSVAVFPVFDAIESFPELLSPDVAIDELRSRMGEVPLLTVLYPGQAAARLWEKSGLESPDVLFERSFAAIQKESLVYETTTPGRFLKANRCSGRAYFPSGASKLLMERSLPASRAGVELFEAEDGPSLRMGSPRRLLLCHEESSALYSKMQYVRILVNQLRGDKSRKKSAQEELWKGQCGDAYWYGPSGGLCRLGVRQGAYASLIQAEKTTRQRGSFAPGVILADIDFDGEKEILYQGSDYNAYVHTKGGALVELDSLKSLTNYIDVLTEDGAPWPRRCFHDHIFASGSFGPELGSFLDSSYSFADSDRPAHLAVLTREGSAELGGKRRQLFLRKSYCFRKGAVGVGYEIANRENEALSLRFAVELNLTAGLSPEFVSIEGLREGEILSFENGAAVRVSGLSGLRVGNIKAEERLEFHADKPFELEFESLRANIEVDGGSKSLYQGGRAIAAWDLEIPADSSVRLSLNLELRV